MTESPKGSSPEARRACPALELWIHIAFIAASVLGLVAVIDVVSGDPFRLTHTVRFRAAVAEFEALPTNVKQMGTEAIKELASSLSKAMAGAELVPRSLLWTLIGLQAIAMAAAAALIRSRRDSLAADAASPALEPLVVPVVPATLPVPAAPAYASSPIPARTALAPVVIADPRLASLEELGTAGALRDLEQAARSLERHLAPESDHGQGCRSPIEGCRRCRSPIEGVSRFGRLRLLLGDRLLQRLLEASAGAFWRLAVEGLHMIGAVGANFLSNCVVGHDSDAPVRRLRHGS